MNREKRIMLESFSRCVRLRKVTMTGNEDIIMKKSLGKIFVKIFACSLAFIMSLALFVGCKENTVDKANIRVGGLKGPTSMGLLFLQELNNNGQA